MRLFSGMLLGMRAHTFAALLVCVALLFSSVPVVAAELPGISISPVVIDHKAQARDILKEQVTIKNTSNQKLNLYPTVNDVHTQEGEQEFTLAHDASDRAASLANWIEISRGVIELSPGEEKVIPFVIRVNMNAIPGSYHASISFYNGSTRAEAEARDPWADIMVNVEVQENIKEELQLVKFFTDNMFFSGDDVLFNYQVENIGNKDLEPKGEIRIYDRRGREVMSLEVNRENKAVSPNQMAQLASVWSAAQGFGKYKAFINVDYGQSQKASVQDTIFFWIVPWQQLLALFTVTLLLVIGGSLYFLRHIEARHRLALAHAGVAGQTPAPAADLAPRAPASEPRVSVRERLTSMLAFFKREAKHASVLHAVPARPKQSLKDALAEKQPERAPEPIVTQSRVAIASPRPLQGGTIDLKNMTARPKEPVQESGSVINLKNHR